MSRLLLTVPTTRRVELGVHDLARALRLPDTATVILETTPDGPRLVATWIEEPRKRKRKAKPALAVAAP